MTLFREHRGGLKESMATVVGVESFADLFLEAARITDIKDISPNALHVMFQEYDGRIGWNSHIVTLDGYGVLGYTDGPLEPVLH